MKIIRNTAESTKFEDLKIGDVFISANDDRPYMKTDEVFEYANNEDHYLNAVSLDDGSMVKFKEWERVLIPQSVTLTIEERKENY